MEINSISRLQFRHHNEVFTGATLEEARELAINYVKTEMWYINPSEECDGTNKNGHSLYAEPTIIKYSVEGDEENAHVILAIGAATNDTNRPENNKFCIIDIDKTEQEIADLSEELEKAIKSLTLSVFDTDSLDLHVEKTEDGTFLSGDVKTSKFHIWDDETKYNSLFIASRDEATGPEGLFIFVDLTYDEITESFTFTTSNYDGSLRDITVKLPNNYLVSGMYSIQDQSLHLKMRNGDDVVVDCNKLIMEWDVEGDASKTPIVLTREQVDYDGSDEYHHLEPWQDVLRADVRITSGMPHNILEKADNGETLYVKGTADNINYHWNGEETTVQEQLNKFNKICKAYQDSDNIINLDNELGFFASARLEYVSDENKLVFTTSSVNGGEVSEEITLNTVEIIESITYDPVTERLILKYKNDKGEEKTVYIPVSGLIDEWTVLNDGHSVSLVKSEHHTSGKDILTADVNISTTIENNILEERGEGNLHALYVKGTADNIKYGNETVQDAIDELKAEDEAINARIDEETSRATGEEERIEDKLNQEIADRIADVDEEQTRAEVAEEVLTNKIGTGFTDDPHENVTYKFEQLSDKVYSEAEKLQDEIDRSTGKDDEHDAALLSHQAEIEAVSADSASSIKDVINNDHSINVDKTTATKPVIKVNLSEEIEHDKPNIIKLNADGLYAGVDLAYEETGNKLIFSTTNGSKEIQLESMSSIISIEYNPTKEAIVITYMTNGHEIKTVEIPVGDLIREWKPSENTDGAIKLTLTEVPSGSTGKDILYGEVLISDHEDNILVNDGGSLYVSNASITANTAAIEALEDRMDTAEANIDALENNLREEVSARTLADEALGARIEQEIEDRVADVNTEETRAISAETELRTAINNETSRSTAKDNEHDTKIQQNADNILAETERAKGVENVISGNVISEETRAINAETTLRTAINDEVTRAEGAESNISHLLDDEIENRISGDTLLQGNIASEEARAREIENRLETWINNEVSRATSAETALNAAITSETLRAQAADNELYQKVSDETAVRAAADADLLSKINQEISRAQVAENTISEALSTETNNRVNADENLSNAITAETQARQSADDTLYAAIAAATFTFNDTTSIDFNTPTLDDNVVKAEVKLQEGDNIIKVGQGLYATAHLSYDTGTNKIKLTTTAGEEEYQLAGATVIDNLEYDSTNKELVITYHDGNGGVHTVRFGVSELFNEWSVQNPSEDSAIELTKTPSATPGGEDKLSGRVLLTNLEDNAIKIVNNGLYVPAADMQDAKEIALCAKNELSVLERAVIGHKIYEECGSGYTYEPNVDATYISGATNFYNADFKLDQNLKRVEDKVDGVSGDTVCVDSKANKIYELLYGTGSTIQGCGEGIQYSPDLGSCVISAATSFMEADRMLGDQMCEILEMWQSGMTCTSTSNWVDDGANKRLEVDVRLSHGSRAEQSDDDIVITDFTGDYIDPTRTEFTDTNALRIVCLQVGESGSTPDVKSLQNGVYLSNVWDCGLYYDETADADAIAAANAAGYKTDNYRTDTGSTASNYDYNNNVRQ